MDDYAGRLLADRYRLPRLPAEEFELAETRAYDTASGQEVLVRQVPLPEVVDAEVVEEGPRGGHPGFGGRAGAGRATRRPADPVVRRAVEAALAASRLPDHPRLDQVFDVFVEGDGLWIVSELVPARPLAVLLAERPLSAHRAAEVAADLLAALQVVHGHGWTHRNITTRTVLVCDDGRALLTGLASGAAEEALCGYDPLPPPGDPHTSDPTLPPGAVPRGRVPLPPPEAGPVSHAHPAPGGSPSAAGAPPVDTPDPGAVLPDQPRGGHGPYDERSGGPLPPGLSAASDALAERLRRQGGHPAIAAARAAEEDIDPEGPDSGDRTSAGEPGVAGPPWSGPEPGPESGQPGAEDPRDGTTAGGDGSRGGEGGGGGRSAAAAARSEAIAAYRAGAQAGRAGAESSERDGFPETGPTALPGPGRSSRPVPSAPWWSVERPGDENDRRTGTGRDGGYPEGTYPVGTGPAAPGAPDGTPSEPGPHRAPPVPAPDGTPSEPGPHRAPPAPAPAPDGGRYRGPTTALAAERARQARITMVGAVTERWAPEQAGPVYENWRLAPPVGPAADLWALGALLFRAVQGHPPYPEEEGAAELVQMVCAEPPAYAEDCGALRPVVESLLRQDPTERPDFEELRGWLRSLIRSAPEPEVGQHVVAVPPSLEAAAPADPRRLPVLRRRGELVRRRKSEKSPVPAHRRHRRPRRPRALGLALVGLVLLAMASAMAYVALFMPKAEEAGGTGGQRDPAGAPAEIPGGDEGRQPSADASPGPGSQPQTTAPSGTVGEGYELREDPEGFRIAVPEGWQRRGRNSNGQVRYTGGGLALVVVSGRDGAAEFGSDPMAYQTEREPELEPYRSAGWASASGLRSIEVGGSVMAEGRFTWREASGEQRFAENRALLLDGAYHLVLVTGPASEQEAVSEHFRQVADTYRAPAG